ncbi:hypothetical protein [Microcoleus sp. S28C3]
MKKTWLKKSAQLDVNTFAKKYDSQTGISTATVVQNTCLARNC